ncbi:Helix-turn-helix [Sporanaerobacter acetigenes DSM 13106]|uniref:Helix-turn-helix n=2 Tax=Sporanaerobacter acetigenes TaxID=165813 RepID=A0A1M5U643_9FIRM|nr:Helix-turn-helix [Sporanaerobacter acetigenes DSM 13106]
MIKRRKELGLTQKDIAKKIGRSRSTYTSYELGIITPSLEVSLILKKILRTEDDDIFLNEIIINNN